MATAAFIWLVLHSYKRYYFSSEGITIYNLATGDLETIPIPSMKGYSYHTGFRGPNSYSILLSDHGPVSIDEGQIKDLQAFKAYFKIHGIPYYEYDFLTGNDYKK